MLLCAAGSGSVECVHDDLATDSAVLLRPLNAADGAAHFAGCDQEAFDRLSGGQRSTLAEMAAWADSNGQAWAAHSPVVDLGIIDRASGQLAGCVGIQRNLDYLQDGEVNLTYLIYPPWRGQGYATRAVVLAMDVAGEPGDVNRFIIRASPDNPASLSVARRAGFNYSHATDDEHGRCEWMTLPAPSES